MSLTTKQAEAALMTLIGANGKRFVVTQTLSDAAIAKLSASNPDMANAPRELRIPYRTKKAADKCAADWIASGLGPATVTVIGG